MWKAYILKLDSLIEEAALVCARKSLHSVLIALRGNGIVRPNVLINTRIEISKGMVCTALSMEKKCHITEAIFLLYNFNL